jgi:hypothetical protein
VPIVGTGSDTGMARFVRKQVRFGSRLCENSNVEFARNIVSIAFNRKRTLLPITVEWRQDRKQFCALSARAPFHTAWVQKRKCPDSRGPSVLPSGADIVSLPQHVRLVPKGDVGVFRPEDCARSRCSV